MMNTKLKSTATNKYETMCYVQEAPQSSEMTPGGYTVKQSCLGVPYVEFQATLWSFGHANRMHRRYDKQNAEEVITTDERIQRLKAQNKWRGERNHPNPDIKGTTLTDVRMTIPEPMRTSHFISHDRFEGDRYKAKITTAAGYEPGRGLTAEIIDNGSVPSFSVRLMGVMIPNASPNMPNMKVSKVITFDEVDFPSHQEADADIQARIQESAQIVFFKDLAKYCIDQSENMNVVCESFQLTPDDVIGVSKDGDFIFEQADMTRIKIRSKADIRAEILNVLRK